MSVPASVLDVDKRHYKRGNAYTGWVRISDQGVSEATKSWFNEISQSMLSNCYLDSCTLHNSVGGTTESFHASTGTESVAVGLSALASGDFGTALGFSAQATAIATTCVGAHSVASGNYSTVFGEYSTAAGTTSIALGRSVNIGVDGTETIAIGAGLSTDAASSVLLGRQLTVGDSCVGVGRKFTMSTDCTECVMISASSTASADLNTACNKTIVIGYLAASMVGVARGVAIGYGPALLSSAADAVSIGSSATCTYANCVAVGRNATADGLSSVAIGYGSHATNAGAIALGNGATAEAASGVAVGSGCVAHYTNSTALGAAAVSAHGGAAVGTAAAATGAAATAVGAGSSCGQLGLAAGAYASTQQIGTALGAYAKVSANNAIAIGSGSSTNYVENSATETLLVGNGLSGAVYLTSSLYATRVNRLLERGLLLSVSVSQSVTGAMMLAAQWNVTGTATAVTMADGSDLWASLDGHAKSGDTFVLRLKIIGVSTTFTAGASSSFTLNDGTTGASTYSPGTDRTEFIAITLGSSPNYTMDCIGHLGHS